MKNKIAVFLLISGLLYVIGSVGGVEKDTLGFFEFCLSVIVGLGIMCLGARLAGKK